MKNLLHLGLTLLVIAVASSAYGQSTNVCGETIATPGGSFTWTSTYSVPIRVEPMPGESWSALLGPSGVGSSYVDIPANGSVTINVPSDLPSGFNVDLQTTFETRAGGNPCGNTPGMPHVTVPP